MARRSAPKPRTRERQLAEMLAFLERYESEPDHVMHVADLALQLFDQMTRRHRLGPRERHLLQLGALAHDTGWSVAPDGRAHHKHSAALVLHHPWKHLGKEERLIVSLLARYHRRALPRRSHEGYRDLDRTGRSHVAKLAAILRVADGLDRGHVQRVKQVTVEDNDAQMSLRIDAVQYWRAEQLGVDKKKDLWEQVYGVELFCLPV